jgi:prepilin peptidase CpaA
VDITQWVFVAAVVVFTLTAAVCDWRTKKLPNWLTVPGLVVAVVYHLLTGAIAEGWSGAAGGMLFALGGFATGFGILLVLWLIGSGGAGDVKLMGALGAWLGAAMTMRVFLVSAVFVVLGSACALALQMISKGMGYTRRRYLSTQNTRSIPRSQAGAEVAKRNFKARRRLMPYGVPVALATWIVLVWSQTN